ncbi:unnamed protein product [Caenorhabditis nigoni]
MANNKQGETESKKSEKNEVHEELNSHKQKLDKITEKLRSVEETVSKIPILSNNQRNKNLKPEKRFVLKHVFKKVLDLDGESDYVESEKEEHFNMKWFIDMKFYGYDLGFHVCCEPLNPLSDEWSIKTKSKFKMMGPGNANASKTVMHSFDNEDDSKYYEFSWRDVEYCLINDNLTCQVEVKILKMTGFEKERIRKFDESQKDFSDVILIVNDTKFYVLKKYLALQSSYFNSLFFGQFDECQKNEIELKDIDPDDFQNFLELIYGESSIDDDTVTGILHLADMYDVPMAIRRCEEFLLKNSEKSMVQKLQLSLCCNLENLKSKCLSEITTIPDIESTMTADFPEMDLSTCQALLQKSIAFSNK